MLYHYTDRLIAAAPDLLSACRLALEAIKDAHHGISTADREAMIEQAIAKAEGTAYPPPRARGQLRGVVNQSAPSPPSPLRRPRRRR